MLVVDASVAVKWLLNEEDSERACALFEQPYRLIAPDLIRLEVLAAIAKAVRKNILASEDGENYASKWRGLIARKALFIVEADSDYSEATTLALEVKHPIYDCLYLAFARHFRVPLVTADKRLEAIAQKLGVECFPWQEK